MSRQVIDNGVTYGINRGRLNANFEELYSIKVEASQVLIKTNTVPFTPTADYHPATKSYIDQGLATWNTVYDPQSIAGDAFDRANHTGTQAPATIATDSSNRFVTDAQISDWTQKEDAIGAKGTAFNKSFGTIAGTVSEGNHIHTKADIGLGNVDNVSDVNKPVSTAQQAALDLKQDTADLQTDIETIVATGDVPFHKYRDTKAIISSYSVLLSDDTLIVAATAGNITITLPLLSSLVGKPYQILEIIPIIVGNYRVKIQTQGTDTFPFGNTYFTLPASQKQFEIGLHEHGFNLRRNIGISALFFRNTTWGSANFASPTAIPWEVEDSNNQPELIDWSLSDAGKIYVRTTGQYQISGGLLADPQAVQAWQVDVEIYKNGAAQPHMKMILGGEGNNNSSLYAASPIDLIEDDYIEMRLDHSLTAAVNITSAQFSIGIRL